MYCVFLESGEYITKRSKTSKNIGRAKRFETIEEACEGGKKAGYEFFYIGQFEE